MHENAENPVTSHVCERKKLQSCDLKPERKLRMLVFPMEEDGRSTDKG